MQIMSKMKLITMKLSTLIEKSVFQLLSVKSIRRVLVPPHLSSIWLPISNSTLLTIKLLLTKTIFFLFFFCFFRKRQTRPSSYPNPPLHFLPHLTHSRHHLTTNHVSFNSISSSSPTSPSSSPQNLIFRKEEEMKEKVRF